MEFLDSSLSVRDVLFKRSKIISPGLQLSIKPIIFVLECNQVRVQILGLLIELSQVFLHISDLSCNGVVVGLEISQLIQESSLLLLEDVELVFKAGSLGQKLIVVSQ